MTASKCYVVEVVANFAAFLFFFSFKKGYQYSIYSYMAI